ncbi:hypothetical protein [Hymenobacter chitinivorans]|uniref:Uncharacterized protein n=1 Tax=Hymenobacter chitinivorans DSM 11115 TaxID=1121954 RepID=A0A2M9BR39_9BACT|nr:hypothetical protein [Hymenobacter chitinivorans]PJJ60372.1 hypothetical protein CLV45_1798 [Hymenobacter chitinivorans DSM 11115]
MIIPLPFSQYLRPLRGLIGKCLVVFGIGAAHAGWGQTPGNSVCWQENVRLRQRDFTASPEAGPEPLLAATHAEVRVWSFTTAEQRVVFTVTVRFLKDKSWFDPGGQTVGNSTSVVRNPDRLLAHEQLHFDIAELTARRIRQRHATYQATRTTQPADPLQAALRQAQLREDIQCLLEDRRALDDLYDAETTHGLLPEPQQQWQLRVQRELLALQQYRSRETDCM